MDFRIEIIVVGPAKPQVTVYMVIAAKIGSFEGKAPGTAGQGKSSGPSYKNA
ncbi:hypothetical protein [uncultured Desulfobacter sp.]|uniref:hypothetical protein n=1 Tax=uncultured Desulfobacter sp. TaxID=240139 RepID=UPI002AA6B534|nr:hypothetical protein [uncultured Desulfobacter sp.]